ncbi:hypothetical protein GJ496_007597 [Pomphorhynchus laevis]|nr:hypothetical protein GJ496_007597 [Pomphorhynchus laevis]
MVSYNQSDRAIWTNYLTTPVINLNGVDRDDQHPLKHVFDPDLFSLYIRAIYVLTHLHQSLKNTRNYFDTKLKMNSSNNNFGAPVPFHYDVVNPFDDDYSFGGRYNQMLFPKDDFFHNFHSSTQDFMNKMRRNFFDDGFLGHHSMSFPTRSSSRFKFPVDINDPNTQSHMHTTTQMMSYSNIDGKPKLVQSHDEKEMGPGGVWRTRKAHRNTSKNIEKMQEGLFIGDKGEIRERYRNPNTGQLEEQLYLRNIPNDQKQQFVDEWNRKASEARNKFHHSIYPQSHRSSHSQNIPIQY